MFITKVRNFIQTHGLITAGDSVLAAVSGGPDSIALLNVLAALSPELQFDLSAAHLNHGIRPEAPEEERFVLAACERLGLECVVGRADARAFASERGCSLEEAARELRHGFLAEQAGRSARGGASERHPWDRVPQERRTRVALGHTLDDQAETVMMRLIRGAGVRGLSAMRPVTERGGFAGSSPASPGRSGGPGQRGGPGPGGGPTHSDRPDHSGGPGPAAVFIRPLLSSTREEVLEFLTSKGIEHVEDASNLDRTFLRNRVRHELLALLKEQYNPAIVEVLGSQAELLNQADDYLTLAARSAYEECAVAESAERIELESARLVTYHVCVQGYVLREAFFRLCGTLKDVTFSHIASLSRLALTGQSGDWLDLPHGAAATLEGSRLVLGWRDVLRSGEAGPSEFSVRHEPGSRTWLPEISLGIESRLLDKEDLKNRLGGGEIDSGGAASGSGRAATEVFFDFGALSPPLVLRSLRPGDRISPFGMHGSKKVQDLLVDMKVPRGARRNLAALCDGGGMLWLVGVRRGSAAPVKEDTERVLAVRSFEAQ